MTPKEVLPHTFIIFGATGDLTRRSLLPSLYQLAKQGQTREKSVILGTARTSDLGDEGFRKLALEALEKSGVKIDDAVKKWSEALYYHGIGEEKLEDFAALGNRLEELEKKHQFPQNRIFYLALPPIAFPPTIEKLGNTGLNKSNGWTKIVVEKPFGRDLETAQELNRLIHCHFDESQIYRIDHYLGKETVQNLLIFRFANPIFESLWNRERIHSVQITVAEDAGIGKRAGYYDRAGALRDMVQNHLTQLLTLIAMEIPAAFEVDFIRSEKVKVLRSIAPLTEDDVIFGQYARGQFDGKSVPGYLEEDGVKPDSQTETFVSMLINIANWRWYGVPFYLRTGKRLPQRLTQIAINFRRPPVSVFDPIGRCDIHYNALIMTLQPDEGFDLLFEMKALGEPLSLQTQKLHFRYAEAFAPLPDAYQTLLLDVMVGDQTLFVHADEVEASWRLYTPVIEMQLPRHPYPAGSWGPTETSKLYRREMDQWALV